MPILEDPREERFAQEIARGNSQTQAYLNAGYTAKNNVVAATQASKLLRTRSHLNERIGELTALLKTEAANTEFVVSVDHLTRLLLEDRVLARSLGQLGASVSALREIRTLHGLGSENLNVKGEFSLFDAIAKARTRAETDDAG